MTEPTEGRARSYYQILGVGPDATTGDVEAAYLELASSIGLTSVAASDELRTVTVAWQTLRDPATRAAYDRVQGGDQPGSSAEEILPATRGSAAERLGRAPRTEAERRFLDAVDMAEINGGTVEVDLSDLNEPPGPEHAVIHREDLRLATVEEFARWLQGYVEENGTDNLEVGGDVIWPDMHWVDRDFAFDRPLFGSEALVLLSAPGVDFLGGDTGHCKWYAMEDYSARGVHGKIAVAREVIPLVHDQAGQFQRWAGQVENQVQKSQGTGRGFRLH